MEILFIQTGGTIDKEYPKKNKGYAFEITEPAAAGILEKVNPSFEYEIMPLLRKDSLDIDDEDREEIRNACIGTNYENIIITHGTDTILQTAEKLKDIPGKKIILTGSFRPSAFRNTDADFNIGLAVGAVPFLEPGIYIAMNGVVIPASYAERDKVSGKFIFAEYKNYQAGS